MYHILRETAIHLSFIYKQSLDDNFARCCLAPCFNYMYEFTYCRKLQLPDGT